MSIYVLYRLCLLYQTKNKKLYGCCLNFLFINFIFSIICILWFYGPQYFPFPRWWTLQPFYDESCSL